MDGRTEYRGDTIADCLAYAGTRHLSGTSFVGRGNPYAAAGFYLGSYLNEIGQAGQALTALDQGLLAAPDAPALVSVRGTTLIALHRWDEALANDDRGLATDNWSDADRARLYRNRGYALTELKRLDEAEQAYLTLLKLDPDNPLANAELAYIASLRAGDEPQSGGLISVQSRKSN